ncbi:hypothetical protein P3626_23225 [Vibrio parahaemolyticus]|uniref:hypothetical protein n=1 Tax=Vibrio parahaemolyticus TaxID=670 RepID=UPI00084B2551|nr:hypothetical protein [Vibrio parahaemolyticus]MBE4412991.1 hypothetical protein [Vibrio parahaemolyticus]MCX8814134.1 hypothetical protein [Vibrio parahaemolyticus]MCX8838937.1 hypothetical protein [Vibrio parahaemolyticus]MCX8909847.1 hypothetical protein [Vibrio parahaemolyticus]MDF4572532.1 hypothetical protein [Vibrio parahaemolyticus]
MIETMLSIYWSTFKRRPFITMVALIAYVSVIFIFITITEKEKGKEQENGAAISSIIASLDTSQDEDALSERLRIIFNSHNRKLNGSLMEYGYVQLLEDAYTEQSNSGTDLEKLNLLLAVIKKEKVKDPFYGLKFEQELVIKNLESLLQNEDNKLLIVGQIKEIVRRQNLEIDELKKNNALGIPLGIAGLLFTVIFGLLGLAYPVLMKRKDG